jgi:hypothetical protein
MTFQLSRQSSVSIGAMGPILEPILRLWNLQLQRQRCSILERFSKYVEENNFVFKMRKATCGLVNFYSAGVVTHDRGIGS